MKLFKLNWEFKKEIRTKIKWKVDTCVRQAPFKKCLRSTRFSFFFQHQIFNVWFLNLDLDKLNYVNDFYEAFILAFKL